MVDFMHQRKLPADFAAREPFAGQPVEVRPGQVGNESALVLSKGHGDGDEMFEIWGLHAGIVHGFPLMSQV
ncbi:hypothetical protein WL00_18535 [Burkholderia cepacia]|nr:hypothetical protein WL00_18535 [Burkholderia cepacia]